MRKFHLGFAPVLVALASVCSIARGDDAVVLSVSGPQSIVDTLTARLTPTTPPAAEAVRTNHPELFGCVLVGAYMLYRSRRRRIL
jgi:hypothetical protein